MAHALVVQLKTAVIRSHCWCSIRTLPKLRALHLPGCSLPSLAEKPRLLVCAPSNAAADELLQRVMGGGFIGNDGRTYFPNVVR